MGKNNKAKRNDLHQKIRQYKNKITREFVIEGKEEFLFPNFLPDKYFGDLIYDYKRIGVLITEKESVMQGIIFEMKLIGDKKQWI